MPTSYCVSALKESKFPYGPTSRNPCGIFANEQQNWILGISEPKPWDRAQSLITDKGLQVEHLMLQTQNRILNKVGESTAQVKVLALGCR